MLGYQKVMKIGDGDAAMPERLQNAKHLRPFLLCLSNPCGPRMFQKVVLEQVRLGCFKAAIIQCLKHVERIKIVRDTQHDDLCAALYEFNPLQKPSCVKGLFMWLQNALDVFCSDSARGLDSNM